MNNKFRICVEEIQEQPIDPRSQIEIEEDHQRIAIELDDDTDEINRQSELVEGLESLQYIASKLDMPSATEIALFRVAANMAVIGTEKSARDFLPAMESYKPIALEGFGERIMDFIRAIIAKLKEWWNNFVEWVKGIFSKEEKVKEEIKETKEKLAETVKKARKPAYEKVVLTNKKASEVQEEFKVTKIDKKDITFDNADDYKNVSAALKGKDKVGKTIEVSVNKLLLNRQSVSKNKITLDSINETIESSQEIAKFSIESLVPHYIKTIKNYFGIFKTTDNRSKLSMHINSLRPSLEAAFKNQVGFCHYFTKSQNNEDMYTDLTSIAIYSHLDQSNPTNPFSCRIKYEAEQNEQTIKCEQILRDPRHLLTDFDTKDIKDFNKSWSPLIKNNSTEIEKLNKEIQAFALKLSEEIKNDSNSPIKEYDIKKITDMCLLLNNVQKYSVNSFEIFIESLKCKVKLYNKIITYYI